MEVFNSKWFSRTWVQQEAVLATDIVFRYKARHLSWKHLTGLARSIRQNSSKLSDRTRRWLSPEGQTCLTSAAIISSMDEWRSSIRQNSHNLQLEDLTYGIRYCQSTDPGDKVFAVLSLVPKKSGDLLFAPDYHLSTVQVHVLLARSSILEFGNPNILKYVKHVPGHVALPSWAPQWSSGDQSGPPAVHSPLGEQTVSTGSGAPPDLSSSVE